MDARAVVLRLLTRGGKLTRLWDSKCLHHFWVNSESEYLGRYYVDGSDRADY